MMTVGSLFSGIGGFELGLERTGGFKTAWQCEKDEFCLKVLEKHWPDVKRFTDIHEMKEDIPYVDVICGGFPCQPVSCAGKRKGKEDERWLWPEFYRIVCEVKPRWVLVENVPGLLSADSGRLFAGILRDLASSGYDAEWNIVSAASVGAPHLRKRVFIVANTPKRRSFGDSKISRSISESEKERRLSKSARGDNVVHPLSIDPQRWGEAGNVACQSREAEGETQERQRSGNAAFDSGSIISDTKSIRCSGGQMLSDASWARWWLRPEGDNTWSTEPDVGRVAHGVPSRVDRLRSLGNAIVPQCSAYIGECVLAAEGHT